ncbi:DUF3389 family protein [Thaumasiovibrio subtropicus]|uniref:DUF3389 family protein n=1 Tax=Thaumasiovibrio subtropicus TaxID=1891207 RepID=UPI000B35A0DB|nr:DUF3389 family protein [Thaumasiovibrio subtropicus]
MKLAFSRGDIYVTPHEVVVKFNDETALTLKAAIDTVFLYQAAKVIAVRGSGAEWSMKLDNEEQLVTLAELASIELL